jgi:hypothetical protein
VAPVYQPEVAAKGIVFAATHDRREVWVGGSTVATILGNKVGPSAADLYLAATNVKAQQTDRAVAPSRRDYLFEPLAEDRGAHGPFGDEAKTRSLQLSLSMHRGALAIAAGALLAGAGALLAGAGALLAGHRHSR